MPPRPFTIIHSDASQKVLKTCAVNKNVTSPLLFFVKLNGMSRSSVRSGVVDVRIENMHDRDRAQSETLPKVSSANINAKKPDKPHRGLNYPSPNNRRRSLSFKVFQQDDEEDSIRALQRNIDALSRQVRTLKKQNDELKLLSSSRHSINDPKATGAAFEEVQSLRNASAQRAQEDKERMENYEKMVVSLNAKLHEAEIEVKRWKGKCDQAETQLKSTSDVMVKVTLERDVSVSSSAERHQRQSAAIEGLIAELADANARTKETEGRLERRMAKIQLEHKHALATKMGIIKQFENDTAKMQEKYEDLEDAARDLEEQCGNYAVEKQNSIRKIVKVVASDVARQSACKAQSTLRRRAEAQMRKMARKPMV